MAMETVEIYNRESGKPEKEEVFSWRFKKIFYGTGFGRIFMRIFFKRKFASRLFCYFQNKNMKKINEFIEKYGIRTDEFELPVDSFKDFNDFFTRKLKAGARPISKRSDILISPADARLRVFPIKGHMQITVKGRKYGYDTLIGNPALMKDFENGLCLIFRLVPGDYHRYCYPDEGVHDAITRINGHLHVSSPQTLVTRHFPLYHDNYREYCILNTRNFGAILQIEVGAMTVGRIKQHKMGGGAFLKGEEKGYFEYGGSTILLVIKPLTVTIDEDIMRYSRQGIETMVRYGSGIGAKCGKPTNNEG
jgi:phosphatidylserine decarboxylase